MDHPQLLVIDYPGRRKTGHVADLRLADHGVDVHYAMRAELPDELHGAAYARQLIARSGVAPARLAGVVGYCMAGHLAQEAAARLTAATPAPPALILLDSGPSSADELWEECRDALGVLGGGRSAVPIDEATGRLLFDPGRLRAEPHRTIEEVRSAVRQLAVEMLAEDTADEEETEEATAPLVDHFLDWLTHLVAAHNSASPAWGGDALHIVSRDHPFRAAWPGAQSTSTVTIDCARNDLLGHQGTRDAILSLLRTTGPAR
ncbi:hypothetical protein [Streptomyces sp. CBMA123]|uniref:hypothetical protein n=1 Tax=Streptomyces sp. CBMA123 TaxID=1896313 RepID=UPI0016621AA6|nr:hypothetical protein [Streptomyces sp. CBMA123]MBD0689554.1 hypothetical protein [Streptomyces sp. CBMA123]